MHEMNPRERAIRAMNFEETDRLPIMTNGLGDISFVQSLTGLTPEEYWADQPAAHYQVSKMLGMDFFIQKWFPPKQNEDRVWALDEEKNWSDPDLVAQDIEKTITRNDMLLFEVEQKREDKIKRICQYQIESQKQMGDDLLWIFGMDENGAHIIGFPYDKYGYEGFFMALALYPDIIERYWLSQAKLCRVHNECVAEAASRLNWNRIAYLGTDMTDQRGNMVHPKVMQRYYFPQLDFALEPLVKADFKLVWHCDGNMNDMLPPLLDIGIAGVQGFQEECGTQIAEVAKLRTRKNDPLILWGSCNVLQVLRNGNFNDIKEEIDRVLSQWPHPGLCLATQSYLGPDVPRKNIVEFYRLARQKKGRSR